MINTLDVNVELGSGGGPSKVLEYGNHEVTVVKVILDENRFQPDSYFLKFIVEGPDMGDDFQGLLFDKNDPSLGRHRGQVGWVKANQYAFADKNEGGLVIKRDQEILKYIKLLALECEAGDWFIAQNGKHSTIQEFIQAVNESKFFKDKPLRVCIGSRRYESKGYMNNDLFLTRWTKKNKPFESVSVPASESMIPVFNETEHVYTKKEKEVSGFSSDGRVEEKKVSTKSGDDFDL
jgi:hypothetical protein